MINPRPKIESSEVTLTSVQLPTSFIQIRFSCNQNIGEWIFLVWVSASPMFWLQENLLWMKKVGNWTEVHTYWNYLLLRNYYFSFTFKNHVNYICIMIDFVHFYKSLKSSFVFYFKKEKFNWKSNWWNQDVLGTV